MSFLKSLLPSPKTILQTAVVMTIVFAIAELAGVGGYVVAPISTFKNKFGGG